MPAYPGFVVPKKTYREVTQWQRKEMRNLGRIVLGAFTIALRDPPKAFKTSVAMAMKYFRSVIDFHFMTQYITHTIVTWNYMESDLKEFHKYRISFWSFELTNQPSWR